VSWRSGDRTLTSIDLVIVGVPVRHDMSHAPRWTAVALVFAIACGFALVNALAAANLGYDTLPDGRAIILRWLWTFAACGVLSFAAAVAAWRARRGNASSRQ
jgi:uncharacterized protein YcsI (UPF0317 family)